MSVPGLVLILRYRKAVTYGLHVLLGALEEHETGTPYDVRFADSAEATAAEIRRAAGARVLVLWSFYSPDAEALAAELASVRMMADGPHVIHIAGGVHATAEPVQTLDAGWDVAAVGEGETTLLRLVDAGGDPGRVPGVVYRDAGGAVVRTGRPEQRPLDTFRGFSLRWHRFNALEIGINVDMIFGMPGENRADVDASLRLAGELADLGARIHAHTFMPLPGTPWRDAPPGDVDPVTIREVDRLSQRGALYGHWQRQRDHAVRLAAAAEAYPRPGRSRTILPTVPPEA